MIGVRNPKKGDPDNLGTSDDGLDKCVEVWVNELRLTDFNQQGGWATIGRVNAQLADFADVSVSGNYSTPYFGGIEQKVGERQQEYIYGVDASTTVQLGKFFGNSTGLQLPMYMGYSNNTIKPLYDPLNPDLEFEKNPEETDEEWKERFENGSDITERRSLNFTNVRLDPSANKQKDPKKVKKPHFYDVKNFSVSYSYNEITHVDINTQVDRKVSYLGGLTYGFSNSPKPWEPFKRTKAFRKSKWLRLIKDFNLYFAPKKIGFRTTMDRTYNEYEIRSNIEGGLTVPNYTKTFNWDRDYDFKYDLTKSLKFDFTAKNRAFINDPFGKVDQGAFGYNRESANDSVNTSLKNFGETMNYGHTMNVSYRWPLNKFPITDWMSLNTRYSGNFDWTQAPLAFTDVGNVVQNSRVIQWNGKLNMTTLYNKVPYLKKVNQNSRRRRPTRRTTRGKQKPEEDPEEGDKKKDKKNKSDFNVLEELAKIVMSLKNVSGTFSTNDGILMPGFGNRTDILGLDENFRGQSWEFVAGGFQELDVFGRPTGLNYAETAYRNGWLVDSTNFGLINTQYAVTHSEKLNLKATLKPIKGLRVDLTADYNIASNNTSNLGVENNGTFNKLNERFTGSFSRSIVTWNTAFVRDKGDNSDDLTNATFENLRAIRSEVSQTLGATNANSDTTLAENNYAGGYNGGQQDVVIGAFLAAYTGQNINEKNVNPFRKMPLPNWRISYDGLSKVKWVQKFVKTLTFTHAYRSNFNMGGYTTNLAFEKNSDGATELDMAGNFISEKQIMNVAITEQFQPLLGANLTLKNGIKGKLEIKKDRNIALSLSNNQITEIKGSELVIGSGYIFKKLQLPFKFNGKKIDPSDLNLDLSISIRDNKTITRKIIENQNQATAGQNMISIKFNGQYNLSKNLMIRAYYDRVVNTPVISTSFPTANTKAGFALRFMLQ
jgi:cell surface protein SprA